MAVSQFGRAFFLPCVALCWVLISSVVIAGPLATTNLALNDGFGPDAGRWHGSVVVTGMAHGDSLTAAIDWAAFGPGKFQQFLDAEGIAQVDPSGPDEVIYVYQITSVASASPGIDSLTVGIDVADGRGVVLAPSFLATGGTTEKAPHSGGDNTTSMAWFFNGTELQPGDTSSLLVFTSPFAPEFDFLQVNSGLAGPSPSPLVASPSDRLFQFDIPEPTTLTVGLMCSIAMFCSRRSRD